MCCTASRKAAGSSSTALRHMRQRMPQKGDRDGAGREVISRIFYYLSEYYQFFFITQMNMGTECAACERETFWGSAGSVQIRSGSPCHEIRTRARRFYPNSPDDWDPREARVGSRDEKRPGKSGKDRDTDTGGLLPGFTTRGLRDLLFRLWPCTRDRTYRNG